MSGYSYSCILFPNFIKPQQEGLLKVYQLGCILFPNFIKPQLPVDPMTLSTVVFYFQILSNHNDVEDNTAVNELYFISKFYQTTTDMVFYCHLVWLYFISKFYQTTTAFLIKGIMIGCILFPNFIKPQHYLVSLKKQLSCILFPNFIKPQRCPCVVLKRKSCILFPNFIKPQLYFFLWSFKICCILFPNFIKPQPRLFKHLSPVLFRIFSKRKNTKYGRRSSLMGVFFKFNMSKNGIFQY